MARLPNVPTVWSNVFTAWVIGCSTLEFLNGGRFCLALIGGTLCYIGGTILNDVADVEFDHEFRPERPIPSGRISRQAAKRVSVLSLGVGRGLLIASGSPYVLVGLLLACILAYTRIHKRSGPIGACLMGLCRFLLGLTIAFSSGDGGDFRWNFALFLYVLGVSWLAQGESRLTKSSALPPLLLLMASPWLLALLSLSVYSTRWVWSFAAWVTVFIVWVFSMVWIGFPLLENSSCSKRGMAVGRALAAIPLVDAIFLIVETTGKFIYIPFACIFLVLIFRRFAAAT